MAISIVQRDPNSTTWRTANSVTSLATLGTGSATTTGNRLVATVNAYQDSGTITEPSVSDNGTHSWTNVAYSDEAGATPRFCSFFSYTVAITGRTDHEVTVTCGATSVIRMGVMEVSGIDSDSPVSDSDVDAQGGTSISLNAALTLSGGTDLVLMLCNHDLGTLSNTWSGSTDEWNGPGDFSASKLSSAASENPTMSSTQSANWCAAGVAFRPEPADIFPNPHDGVKPWASIWRPSRI